MSRPSRQETKAEMAPWVRPVATSLLASLLLIGLLSWGVVKLRDPLVMPVRVVGVDGEIQYLQRDKLEAAVADAVDGGFFSIDLDQVRQKVERLPWIESASVRRVWPDTLLVNVVEQIPLAYWGDDGLVSQRGEVFRPEQLPQIPDLPRLEGEDQNALGISKEYLRMRTLLETAGLRLDEVRVDPRQAWWLQTKEGVALHLGRRDVMLRLTRFVQLYPFLKQGHEARPASVDLRYTNGFTVRWQEAEAQVNLNRRSGEHDAARIAGI